MDRWISRHGPLAARILLAHIFLISGLIKIFKYSETKAYMESAGLAPVDLFLVLAILIEVIGGLSLLLGFASRATAWVLAFYLLPVTLAFHQFWNATGAQVQQQQVEFMKNLAIIGGLLAMTTASAGELSLDALHPSWFERLAHPFHRKGPHAA